MYSEKATKFCEISTLLLSYVVPVKSKVEISKNFVAFSEYMNFTNIAEILTSNCEMGVLFLEKLFQLRRMNLMIYFTFLYL